jgi:hypothetical protein
MKYGKLTYINKKFSSPVHNQRTSLLSQKKYNKGAQLNHSNPVNHLEYVFIKKGKEISRGVKRPSSHRILQKQLSI